MTGNFFNAVILSTAKSIARLFTSGDVTEATRQLEAYMGDLDAAASAAFLVAVQDFVVGKR